MSVTPRLCPRRRLRRHGDAKRTATVFHRFPVIEKVPAGFWPAGTSAGTAPLELQPIVL
jgi:hypothetical protein